MASGKGKAVELLSGITGKGTTRTARSLASVSTTLENKIRRLERKKELTARAKPKEEVSLSEAPFDYNKGGMARKKYAKGGYANCGASMKPTQKSTNMAYGGMARKK